MMRKKHTKGSDYVGCVFGRLTVLSLNGRDKTGKQLVNCKCDCGKESVKSLYRLVNGRTKSCGCLHKEVSSEILRSSRVDNSLPAEDLYEILFLRYMGFSIRAISRMTGISKNTVQKYSSLNKGR